VKPSVAGHAWQRRLPAPHLEQLGHCGCLLLILNTWGHIIALMLLDGIESVLEKVGQAAASAGIADWPILQPWGTRVPWKAA
jgi:hypothetical protein